LNLLQNYTEQNRIQYFADILILIGLFLTCSFLSALLGYLIGAGITNIDVRLFLDGGIDFAQASHRMAYKISSLFTQVGTFVGAVFVLTKIRSYSMREMIAFKMPEKPIVWPYLLLFVPATIILSFVLINWSDSIHFFKDLENLLGIKNLSNLQLQLLQMDSTAEMLFNLFFVALVPAVCEEIFFRGMLQKLFNHLTGTHHFGILLTSLVFALIHFNLPMLVPYLFLSITLGYLYQLTGSIYVSMLFHFVWNGFTIWVHYMAQSDMQYKELSQDQYLPSMWLIAVSLVVYIYFYILYRKKNNLSYETE
jgi:membrane protease YdiL (CAAX protease family)